jgi:hypothetical protein
LQHGTNDDGKQAVSFNVNALVTGVLLAAVLSAMGFSDGDPMIQWYLPGGILLLSIAYGVLRPSKRPVRQPQTKS